MTENYELKKENPNFVYAGFWIRFLAFIIDMAVVSAISSIIHRLIGSDMELGYDIWLYSVITIAVMILYFTLMTYFTNGQTLGKMMTNIRVVSLYGDKLTFGQVVSRETFGRYVQNKLMFLYVITAFAPKKQSLFDMLSDTAVIKIEPYNYVNLEIVTNITK